MRKISIIHPSRGRGLIAVKTAENWLSRADGEIDYNLSLDHDDPTSDTYINLFKGFPVFKFHSDNRSAVDAINNAAAHCTGDLMIVVSDDFDCPPHWDTQLLNYLKGSIDFLVKTPDGIQPTLITLPIMDRAYYNRFGYIYHPEYLHMYSDQEMTAVGHMLGRVINIPVAFTHNHYMTRRFKKDAISERNDSTYPQGKQVFERRLATNFGVENPVKPYSEIKWR